MPIVFKPPIPVDLATNDCAVFLAGSIEMGAAEDWQTRLTEALEGVPSGPSPGALTSGPHYFVVLNPRRDDWDASWRQSIDEPRFREQVEWELDGLARADVIAMWFAPETKAPITLLELGLHARGGKLVIGCPDGYWRRGNIEVVCARFGIPLYATWEAFVAAVIARVAQPGASTMA